MIHSGDTFTPHGRLKYAHPLEVDEVAVDHPDLKIVICHLGNPWLRDCMEVIYKNKNVHADISGLALGDFDSKFERWMRKQIERSSSMRAILYAVQRRVYRIRFPLREPTFRRTLRSLEGRRIVGTRARAGMRQAGS